MEIDLAIIKELFDYLEQLLAAIKSFFASLGLGGDEAVEDETVAE